MHHQEQHSPYRGFFVTCLILIGMPLIFYVLVHTWFGMQKSGANLSINKTGAEAIGFGLGTIFHLSCLVAGAFSEPYTLLKRRILDFRDNLEVSFPLAVKCYLQDMRDDGVTFTVYFVIMVICFVLALNGVRLTWF